MPGFACRLSWLLPLATIAVPALADEQAHIPDPEMGKRLVEARCMACHEEKSLPFLVLHCMADGGEAYLDTYLREHHAPDLEARADIIAYLTCEMDVAPSD